MKKYMSMIMAIGLFLAHGLSAQVDIDKLLPPDSKISLRTGFDAILAQYDDVPAVMMSLLLLSADAREKKMAPPRYNMCDLLIMKDTKFCYLNKGIERIRMPQLMGKPVPGGKAAQMAQAGTAKLNSVTGEVDLQVEFQVYLKGKGFFITEEDVDAFDLKATQSELVGGNVAGMWFALKVNPQNSNIRAPIFVSQDNYILDGHHRWASVMSNQFGIKDLKPFTMPVFKINTDITHLLQLSAEFLEEYGIQSQAGK